MLQSSQGSFSMYVSVGKGPTEQWTISFTSLYRNMLTNYCKVKCNDTVRIYLLSFAPKIFFRNIVMFCKTIFFLFPLPSQTFSPRYATFSPFFASFVTLSPHCNLSPHIIDNYATLCNIICQLNYRQKINKIIN